MEVTFLQVADYANTTKEEKLNVMGIFGNIAATSFPSSHPEMYLVAQLRADAHEYGRNFKLRVNLINEDASEQLVGFEAPVTVPTGQKGLPVTMNFIIRLVNTVFRGPGTYEFALLVNDDQKGTLPLEIIQLPQAP